MKKEKYSLEKSITCSSLDMFQKVIKKLSSLGYENLHGLPLYNLSIHTFEWGRGMKVINLYSDKGVKFASTYKNLKNVISDIDFLKPVK